MADFFLDPGRLAHRLVLEAPETEADGLGGHELTWLEVAMLDALVEPRAQSSRFGADQTREETTHRVSCAIAAMSRAAAGSGSETAFSRS